MSGSLVGLLPWEVCGYVGGIMAVCGLLPLFEKFAVNDRRITNAEDSNMPIINHISINGQTKVWVNITCTPVLEDVPNFVPQIWEYDYFSVRKLVFTL